jgi:hypothetical protein
MTDKTKTNKVGVEYKALDDLHAHPNNARIHPEASLTAVKNSIETFGFVNPIIALADGTIVAGEGRWRAARAAGLDQVPVVVVDMTEQEALSYLVVDNATTELSFWDDAMMEEIAGELAATDWDLRKVWEFDFIPELPDDPGAPGTEPPAPPAGPGAAIEYRVITLCTSETDQKELCERLEEEGYQCKLLMS